MYQSIIRLLNDPRSQRFSDSFADQWLSLDKLGSMPPDAKDRKFQTYYRNKLESAMLGETRRFFKHILYQNRSIRDFIDSDYTFVNPALAAHYKLPYPAGEGNGFVLAQLPADSKRGGLLGHASVHSQTSNGVETSPVERGHWVLDEFLGTPPPPAPKEVPALVPDLQGVTTVRQQLEQHRSDPACMECHRKMDPPGFALEAFDPIGRLRTSYPNSKRVETDSEFLGVAFQDVDGLKDILMTQSDTFARSLVVKIAEYAKGRKLDIGDLPVVEQILSRTKPQGYPLQSIVAEIAISDLMTKR